ncbi:MAG: MarR family transcriptional regulator [Acidibrevibacterium sp.]|jgi:MarR family 2-MHQ and catechol resistance regulon transcriptional repressor|uniref:MarR family winged helix-turn-helix transcriptional regulator n=1 Tax=Acidibrevibacterium fodinaquatile TaxID=1969806 RepID=UPI0023A8E873|nr:MarR family transcriptional regulator [Acidibrevibacterium fodinaquatile]MCA7118720.1 MarR family transcriptional regulator [Acidibrevibacterium fodinaquatile]
MNQTETAAMNDAGTAAALRAYVKLFRASRAILARVEPGLAAHGLTATQLGVLEVIWHQGPLTQGELGRKVLTSAGNMTDVVDKLSNRGLVRRVRDLADRRHVRVELTGCGRDLIAAVFPRHAQDITRAMSGLSPCELELLGTLLRQLGRHAAGEEAALDDAVRAR